MSTLIETIATHRRAHSADNAAIRPFRVSVPEAELTHLRRRITATKFPERETVNDMSQGAPLATVEKLARYWATEYDWRKVEVRLNALPQFITEIDGLDIYLIHVRSKHENALPIIVSHGWPGSFIEQLKIQHLGLRHTARRARSTYWHTRGCHDPTCVHGRSEERGGDRTEDDLSG